MKEIRLDKFLADSGLGTRSAVKELLKKGMITIDGQVIKRPEFKFDPSNVTIFYQGNPLVYQSNHYYLLNKPAGVVTATEDKREKTVLDLFPAHLRKNIFPVGRLDKDTVGLLLLTDDGELAHRLLSPKKHVAKTYEALVDGCMTPEDCKAFEQGLDIGDDKITLPAKLEIIYKGEKSLVHITLTEGRFHQVKRMCNTVGKPVISLKRLSMGTLELDKNLREGDFRPLTDSEIRSIQSC